MSTADAPRCRQCGWYEHGTIACENASMGTIVTRLPYMVICVEIRCPKCGQATKFGLFPDIESDKERG